MKQRPILFKGAMVRAILNDSKTQTRRIAHSDSTDLLRSSPFVKSGVETMHGYEVKNRFGLAGDQLWVRETWSHDAQSGEECRSAFEDISGGISFGPYYLATELAPETLRWIPSIHMPKWASRITLSIESIHIEPLNSISIEDAIAEGLTKISKDGGKTWKYGIPDKDGLPGKDDDGWPWADWELDPRIAYRKLWESINGAGSWDLNPWVTVIKFKRINHGSN